MNIVVMPDGVIRNVTNMVAEYLISQGGKTLKLEPIHINTNGNIRTTSSGSVEILEPRKRRIRRGSQGKVSAVMDKK